MPEEADACFAELVGEFAPVLAKIKVEPACVCACACACMACGVLAVHMGACASMHMCAWLCGWMDGWMVDQLPRACGIERVVVLRMRSSACMRLCVLFCRESDSGTRAFVHAHPRAFL